MQIEFIFTSKIFARIKILKYHIIYKTYLLSLISILSLRMTTDIIFIKLILEKLEIHLNCNLL